jgi:hypothetical protein
MGVTGVWQPVEDIRRSDVRAAARTAIEAGDFIMVWVVVETMRVGIGINYY